MAELEMNGNIDAIHKHVCHLVRWIVCPFCKYFSKSLLVDKGGIEIISIFSALSWRPLQNVLGLHMQEGEVFDETCLEWLMEVSRRTTVITNSLKEFEDLLEQFEEVTFSGDCSDSCCLATITQCSTACHLSSEELTSEGAESSTGSTGPMEQFDKPKPVTIRHKLRTDAEGAGLSHLCSRQQQHVINQKAARKRWRHLLLVIRIVRVLLSLPKARGERYNCPAKSRGYTPARPPLLPCPPSCIQTRPERAEAKSVSIMMFSQAPQIHLISLELRVKLESHVRRKLTHRLFGFPPRLAKLLGDNAVFLLKCQGKGDGRQAHNWPKPKLEVYPNRNVSDLKDAGQLDVVDFENTGQQEKTKAL